MPAQELVEHLRSGAPAGEAGWLDLGDIVKADKS